MRSVAYDYEQHCMALLGCGQLGFREGSRRRKRGKRRGGCWLARFGCAWREDKRDGEKRKKKEKRRKARVLDVCGARSKMRDEMKKKWLTSGCFGLTATHTHTQILRMKFLP